MQSPIDFASIFQRLAQSHQTEETVSCGGVSVRLVRVAGGGEGRWDSHAQSTEIALVWSGDFMVEFTDQIVALTAGQCCVVPVAARHKGMSRMGAEIVLFQQEA